MFASMEQRKYQVILGIIYLWLEKIVSLVGQFNACDVLSPVHHSMPVISMYDMLSFRTLCIYTLSLI